MSYRNQVAGGKIKEAKTDISSISGLENGVPPLHSLYLYIAGSCNLACKHCWIEPEFRNVRSLSGIIGGKFIKPEYVKKALKEAKNLGLQSVKLTGGEPLLHPQFKEIIDMIAEEGIGIVIETNGTLIDKDLAFYMKANGKISFISVSVDGENAETHDALRGVKGSYNETVKGIKYLVSAGFHPQLICTLYQGNKNQIENLIKHAEDMKCGSVKFNLVQSVGRGESFAKKNGLGIKDVLELYKYVSGTIQKKYKIPIYFDIPMAFYPLKRFLSGKLSRCMILNIIGMISTGDLSICGIGVNVPELIFGNIGKDNLADIWNKSVGLRNLRKKIPLQLKGICGKCIHRDICLGDCVANNYFRTGKLDAPYDFCEQADNLGLFPESRKRIKKQ